VAICTLAALFWALHPQRAEAVAWIAGRKDLLCGLFTLTGLLAWLHGGLAGRISATLCCALACMSKPTGMCFPFLAMAMDAFVRGDAPAAIAADAPRPVRAWLRAILPYLPCLALAAAAGALAVYSQTHAEGYDVRPLFSTSLPWRLLNAATATGLYILQLVVPTGIHLDYRAVPEHLPLHGVSGLCALVAALALFAVCILKRPRSRTRTARMCALAIFFLAPLTPTLGIFGSFGEHARADRFLYMPMMATSLAVLMLPPMRPRVLLSIGTAAVAGAFVMSFPLVASYRNDHTAFSRTLRYDPDHGRALAHVASEECARFGHIDRGIELYRRSQALRPRDDTAAQLSYALMMRGHSADYQEIRRLCAKFACDHSLDRKGQALEALGTTAMRQRRWNEAISCLEASIKAPLRFYSSEDAFLRLGACYANIRRTEDAIRIFEPLTQSHRNDIAQNARQALTTLKANPKAILFF
jgi:tetratricopeptide (TPR) repeat protein